MVFKNLNRDFRGVLLFVILLNFAEMCYTNHKV